MKIDVFSGFLGSGKTTLIKKLVKEAYTGEKVVLIENEFGEIGIDGGFLKDAGIEITEMNSGCICCSLVGDFANALKQVVDKFNPDRIIIEPSGVGKLSDVVSAVEKGLNDIKINSKTTVINANKCLMYAKNFGEFFMNQLENADCIVLSHTDTASDKKISDALSFIKANNPTATVVATPISKLDGKNILSAMEKATESIDALSERLIDEHKRCHHDHEHDEHERCHHDHDHDEHKRCHHDHDHDEHKRCHHDHDHDEHKRCHHDHDHDEHERCHHDHDHDEHERCHHDHDHDEHDHDEHERCHHHHADEVFSSWGKETMKKYTADEISDILKKLNDKDEYGIILRAKGIVASEDEWIHFDFIPDGIDVRKGTAGIIGKICVIGSHINETNLEKLFNL